MASARPPSRAKDQLPQHDQQRLLQDWIDGIKTRFAIEVSAIAARTAPPISPSTIYRWLDPGYPFNPSLAKIRQIARAFNVPMPQLDGAESFQGFAEDELQPIAAEDFAGLPAGADQGRWRITSRVLELAGYKPGDVVLVDLALAPKTGDTVCVQMYDFDTGSAKTRLRIYNHPFVETATMDPRLKEPAVLVDGKSVVIVGTVIRMVRVRPSDG